MTSSSSSSCSAPAREPFTPAASPSSVRDRPLHHPPPYSSGASAIVNSQESTSSANQTLFNKHPIGSVLIAQSNPRLQAVVVGHQTTAAEAPLLSLFQTGYCDRHSQEWVPPKLRDRYINRLPQQQTPPDHVFEDAVYVQQQISQIVREDPSKECTEQDFDALIIQLSAQASLPPPPPIFLDTSSKVGCSSSRPLAFPPPNPLLPITPLLSHSKRHTVNSTSVLPQQMSLPTVVAPPPPPGLTKTVEALSKHLEDIYLYVRSQHSGSQRHPVVTSSPVAPPSHHSHPTTVPGLPTVHPQLLVDTSPRVSSHSRSRSRSGSRDRHSSVRHYTSVYVPCPFNDNRQAMTPAARAKGTAAMRKLYCRIRRGFFSSHSSATRAAKDILITSSSKTYHF